MVSQLDEKPCKYELFSFTIKVKQDLKRHKQSI